MSLFELIWDTVCCVSLAVAGATRLLSAETNDQRCLGCIMLVLAVIFIRTSNILLWVRRS